MELPKNIKQIGEADQHCRIYVEDYVVSYIKQMNRLAENRNMAIALYGVRKEENGAAYVFFYGAAKINSIQKELRHLSQAQNQEIDKLRKRYFSDYEFLGYRLLDGEMVEGFHVCEQGTCRYIKGYACFYEKNDVMLAYMLDSRKEEVPPETVDQEKFERVRRRQEERRAQYRGEAMDKQPEERVEKRKEQKETSKSHLGMMKTAVAAVFLLLCVLGIAGMNGFQGMEAIQTAGKQLIAEFTEQKLPDSETQQSAGQSNTLVTEDKLTDAIQQENAAGIQTTISSEEQSENVESTEDNKNESEAAAENADASENGETAESAGTSESGVTVESTAGNSAGTSESASEMNEANANDSKAAETEVSQEASVQASAPVTYVIKKGDTLTSISINTYGTDSRVKDICDLNEIEDPDDIRFGQKILLP